MTSKLEKQIKEMSIPEKVVTVARMYGKHTIVDEGMQERYELEHNDLRIWFYYLRGITECYAIASLKRTTVFSAEGFSNQEYDEANGHLYITPGKSKQKQLERLLHDVCKNAERKR